MKLKTENFTNLSWLLVVPLYYGLDLINLVHLDKTANGTFAPLESISPPFKLLLLLIFAFPDNAKLFNYKQWFNKMSVVILSIFLLSIFVNYFFWTEYANTWVFFELKEYFKYFYWVLLFLSINNRIADNSVKLKYFLRGFEFVVIVNTTLLLIGFVFEIVFFRSYRYNLTRFGYDGCFFISNEATSFYCISILYLMHKSFTIGRYYVYFFWIIIASSCLIATKSILVVNFLVLNYYFYKTKQHYYYSFGVMCLLMTYVYFSGMYSFFENLATQKGLLYSFSSGRSAFFGSRFLTELSRWDFWNFVFGGHSALVSLMEIDLVDIFLSMGILGSISYFVMLYYYVVYHTNSIQRFSFAVIVILGSLAGHLLNSGVVAIYLTVLIISFRDKASLYNQTNI